MPSYPSAAVSAVLLSALLICVALAPPVASFSPISTAVTWGVDVRRNRNTIFMSLATGDQATVKEKEDDPILSSMPWGDFQAWALRDNLHRYLVTIPSLVGSSANSPDGYETYALWRTMIQDVTELAGYEPNFLMAMHAKDMKEKELEISEKARQSGDSDITPTEKTEEITTYPLSSTPGLLPFLDQFEFTSDGGVSGRAYGLLGIASGAMISTPVVAEVESTVKKGYVRTEDGTVAYELGVPAVNFYSLDGTPGVMTQKARKAMLEALSRAAGAVVKGEAAAGASLAKAVANEEGDDILMKLGGSTAILLAGATAMSMLSHHLTVNVFWV